MHTLTQSTCPLLSPHPRPRTRAPLSLTPGTHRALCPRNLPSVPRYPSTLPRHRNRCQCRDVPRHPVTPEAGRGRLTRIPHRDAGLLHPSGSRPAPASGSPPVRPARVPRLVSRCAAQPPATTPPSRASRRAARRRRLRRRRGRGRRRARARRDVRDRGHRASAVQGGGHEQGVLRRLHRRRAAGAAW